MNIKQLYELVLDEPDRDFEIYPVWPIYGDSFAIHITGKDLPELDYISFVDHIQIILNIKRHWVYPEEDMLDVFAEEIEYFYF